MSEHLPASAGRSSSASLSALRLDPENPRIPETHRTKDTAELATLLEMGFEAYPVAQSIAELGFFNAEPLIVIPSPDEANAWIVVEGNRRLTALIGPFVVLNVVIPRNLTSRQSELLEELRASLTAENLEEQADESLLSKVKRALR